MEKNNKRFMSLINQLENYKKELIIVKNLKDEEKFFEEMNNLLSFFHSYDDEEVYQFFIRTDDYKNYGIFFQEQDMYFEPYLDRKEALTVISSKQNFNFPEIVQYKFSQTVLTQAVDEVEILNQKDIEKIVMVGCGSMPETVIVLAFLTRIKKIIALDVSQDSLTLSKKVLEKLQLSSRVSNVCINGSSFDYSEFDGVHVANFVKDKKGVLNRISETVKKNAVIIVRSPRQLSSLIYESINPSDYSKLILNGVFRGGYDDFFVFHKV